MIDFMVLSAPRSGSTWAANWLTTCHSHCLHDPVLEHRVEELDRIHLDKIKLLGVSCTALALCPDFVNHHPARKVILHRDPLAIEGSLKRIGLSSLSPRWDGALERIEGMHAAYLDLFDPETAKPIYEHLLQTDFDAERHAALVKMRITPDHCRVALAFKDECARDFRHRVQRAFS
jgi:hypothetical protein